MKTTNRKGVFPVLIPALLIMSILALGSFAYYMWSANERENAKFSVLDLETQDTDNNPLTGVYSYENVRPYVTFTFQDKVGTAVNPTCYIYDYDVTSDTDWEDERAWTNNANTYYDSFTASSGKNVTQFDPGQKIFMHCTLSSHEDAFITYTVPAKGDATPGDASSASAGLYAKPIIMTAYDTTAWVSSNISIGASTTANETGAENIGVITRTVSDSSKVCVSQIKLTNLKKYADIGMTKLQIELPGPKFITVYSYNGGIDHTKYVDSTYTQTYDSRDYASDSALLKGDAMPCFSAGVTSQIRFKVTANTWYNATINTTDSYLSPGEVIAVTHIYDAEGNDLTNYNLTG